MQFLDILPAMNDGDSYQALPPLGGFLGSRLPPRGSDTVMLGLAAHSASVNSRYSKGISPSTYRAESELQPHGCAPYIPALKGEVLRSMG